MTLLCICGFSWSTFWTALTAVGTIAMAIITFCTLRKNDAQVAEIKRQWEEDNRPYIDVHLEYEDNLSSTASRYLVIDNYGKGTANDVKIIFDEVFVNNIPIQELRNQIIAKNEKSYKVLPGKSIKEIFCDIIDYGKSGKCRINTEEFDLNQRSNLLEHLNKPIKVYVQFTWNSKRYSESMVLNYNY